MNQNENFRFAAAFAGLSGLLHLIAPVVSGFASESWILVAFGAVFFVIVYGLSQGWRWLAWIAFFWVFVGVIGALLRIWTPGPVPGWLFLAILIANVLALLGLFLALWRSPPSSPEV